MHLPAVQDLHLLFTLGSALLNAEQFIRATSHLLRYQSSQNKGVGSEGEAERQGEEERKEGKGLQEFIVPKKKKNEGELSHFTLLFLIISNVLCIG